MNNFIEIPASKKSLAKRKPVYGVGINDAKYNLSITIGNKKYTCPYYSRWVDMLTRCYNIKSLKRRPTYSGCSVASEWLVFSNFRKWMERQEWQGKHLDKDLLVKGNKVYSSSTCMFIPMEINNILNNHGNARGNYPQGVSWDDNNKKFKAQIVIKSKKKYLGIFKTIYLASNSYQKNKKTYIKSIAEEHKDNLKLYKALLQYSKDVLF